MKRLIIFVSLLTACMVSCTKANESSAGDCEMPAFEESVMDITASIDDFVEAEQSKTNYDPKRTPKWAFSLNDKLGFWSDPTANGDLGNPVQVIFDVKNADDPQNPGFHGNGYGIVRGSTYHSYYPYDENSTYNNLDITYLGQNPQDNGGYGHLGAFDYLYSSGMAPTSGAVAFNYSHLGCLARFVINFADPVPTANIKKFTLSTDDAILVSGAAFDPSTSTIKTGTKQLVNSIDYLLGDISEGTGISLEDGTLIVHAMMSPVDLASKKLTATLTDVSNREYTGSTTASSVQEAGKSYQYTINLNKTATDLSSPEPANCYMVPSAGDYMFKPYKGNTSDIFTVDHVGVLWEARGDLQTTYTGDIISGVEYSNGYITFKGTPANPWV